MSVSEIDELLEAVGRVLFWCWVLGFGLLLASVGLLLVGGDLARSIHGAWFGVGDEYDLIAYCYLGLLKTGVILFYFLPWLAIRLALRGRK